MNRKELRKIVAKYFPYGKIDTEYTTGEIIIATGLKNQEGGIYEMYGLDLPNEFKQYNMGEESLRADETIRTRRERPPE